MQATFFTLTLQDRRSDLLIRKIKELRIAFHRVMKTYPFTIDGIVVLPEHVHMSMTLPSDDINYSQRISFIKSAFSLQLEPMEFINSSRQSKRERGIWQRRFWEHLIRDEQDYERHLDLIQQTAKTLAKVSLEAIPFSKGYYSRKRSIFFLTK